MPGLGLQGAFGVDAMSEAIRQRIKDQLAEQRQTQTLNLNAREQLLREAQAEQERKIQDETLRQLQEERQARAEQLKQATLRSKISLLTPGQVLTPETAAGLPGELRMPSPLMAPAPPEALAAPNDTGESEAIPDTIANAPAPRLQTETYRGTPEQQVIEQQKVLRGRLLADPNLGPRERLAIQLESAGFKVPAGVFEPKPANPLPIHDTAQGLMRPNAQGVMEPVLDAQGKPVKGFHQPQQIGVIPVQTVDASGNPITQLVPRTAGASYAKGPSAVTANRLDSAMAVKQTGEDIINQLSEPSFKAAVGPVLGRAGSLRDFIGNPPPEYAQLAGQIESYALANMGVHGMRSAQGAQQIAQLLDQHHTPESLIAAIQGLNGFSQHFLENAGRIPDAKKAPKAGGVKILSITPVK